MFHFCCCEGCDLIRQRSKTAIGVVVVDPGAKTGRSTDEEAGVQMADQSDRIEADQSQMGIGELERPEHHIGDHSEDEGGVDDVLPERSCAFDQRLAGHVGDEEGSNADGQAAENCLSSETIEDYCSQDGRGGDKEDGLEG